MDDRPESGSGDAQLFADPGGRVIRDLAVPWHGGSPIVGRVLPDGVIAALANESTAVPAQMRQQFTPFHEAAPWAVTATRVEAVKRR